ncbi:MAG: thioredoxin domain-containing protein [Deltaproteobacteria bacterium]|nr:thioredoxin domain-containing protein [Deltaproteobacteria bacterium]
MRTHQEGEKGTDRQPNRLIREKSPYLLQHAYNPVEWYPWGTEAFERARALDRPVFLSIGYSTCHWCHVMERESFEDPRVAALMNDAFVSVKVDREERPDLDHVYMSVCQMVTGSGGWPLTIIMTPDQVPFFAATYLPRENRFGQRGMLELIPRIREIWETRRAEVLSSAAAIAEALQETGRAAPEGELNLPVLDRAYGEFARGFDPAHGGFGNAPKFPSPHNLLFLLRYWNRTRDEKALAMVEKTLRAMRRGGIWDHIGYGFHRYSTDREWLVPHFEKMLYDQAMLALACLETYQATGKDLYVETAREIFTYVLRDMTSPKGGFYSAEDADSEGIEGKFYIWREEDLREALDGDLADLVVRVFQVDREGNFLEEATRNRTGANILHLRAPLAELASDLGMSPKELQDRVSTARERLFHVRERRGRPQKDDKILADWNGLMVAALARGARVLGDSRYEKAAMDAARFVLHHMRRPDGRLLHRYRDGEGGILGHLDDYAFLVWGLIELFETTFDAACLQAALELNEDMIRFFWDARNGGLFFSGDDDERLILRSKEIYDGAVPSGNSVAMWNLLRLARITGRADLEEKASAIQKAFAGQVGQLPLAHAQFLVALDYALGPSQEVVLAGPSQGEDTLEMVKTLRDRYMPNTLVLFRPSDREDAPIDALAAHTRHCHPVHGKATAYVCRQRACGAPVTDIEDLKEMISLRPTEI